MERLADVDVAQAGDQALIQEGGLERRDLVAETGARRRPRSGFAQGLDPHAGEVPAFRKRGRGYEVHEAEAADVVVGHGRAVRHRHHDVVVLGVALGALEVEIPGREIAPIRRATSKRPLMPRCMISDSAESRVATRYFARRARSVTVRPSRRSAKRSGNGNRRFGRRRITRLKRDPTRAVGEAAPYGFDFREFGHACDRDLRCGNADGTRAASPMGTGFGWQMAISATFRYERPREGGP